jgi:hypothetical protein
MAFEIPQGDTSPAMPLQVLINGQPANLADVVIQQMRWRKPDGNVVLVDLTVVSLAKGQFTYEWQAGDTDQAGGHQGFLVLTRSDSTIETFPSSGQPFTWKVKALPF